MIVLGLGSNLGDRLAHLKQAVLALKRHVTHMTLSGIYESAALLPADAPKEWDIGFLNMAVSGETDLSPRALLEAVKLIESEMGRKARGHWGPREIDIDILAYDDVLMEENDLVIPHSELLNRDFALQPFADVAPKWIHPLHNQTACELAAELGSSLTKMDWVIT